MKLQTFAIFLTLFIAGPLFADNPPQCQPLSKYRAGTFTNHYGSWQLFLRGGPPPMNGGGVITTNWKENKDEGVARTAADEAYKKITGGGTAQLYKIDPFTYWACSYGSSSGIDGIYTFSPNIKPGNAFQSSSSDQEPSALEEKSKRAR